jgi:hypothetical protein
MELAIVANSPYPGSDISEPTFRDAVTPIIVSNLKPVQRVFT